jgi:tRNA wybutosine-synthesizing protein 3
VTMEEGLLVFRYEPFILALECRTPAAAQLLVACAVSAGFRESGLSFSTSV